MTESSNDNAEAMTDGGVDSEPFEVTDEQQRGARRTALFFVGLVVLMSILTILGRVFGW